MTKSETERAQYVFAVKEFSDGTPWIMPEPSGEGLGVLENGFLGFDLRNGTAIRDAEKLAELMRELVLSVSFTSFTKGGCSR
jgi:hypothetical protein